MKDWLRVVARHESTVRQLLNALPAQDLSDFENLVLKQGLVVPGKAVQRDIARKLLMNVGLYAEEDYVDFLEQIGSIYLLAMGADDGVLLGATEVMPLLDFAPSLSEALIDGATSASMAEYLSRDLEEEILVFPKEVVTACVAMSSEVGSKIYVASAVGRGNQYIRISIHGSSVRYATFEEFLIKELRLLEESLRYSVEERLS